MIAAGNTLGEDRSDMTTASPVAQSASHPDAGQTDGVVIPALPYWARANVKNRYPEGVNVRDERSKPSDLTDLAGRVYVTEAAYEIHFSTLRLGVIGFAYTATGFVVSSSGLAGNKLTELEASLLLLGLALLTAYIIQRINDAILFSGWMVVKMRRLLLRQHKKTLQKYKDVRHGGAYGFAPWIGYESAWIIVGSGMPMLFSGLLAYRYFVG